MVTNASHPQLWEAEKGRLLQIQGQSDLHSEFQAIWGYAMRPCL